MSRKRALNLTLDPGILEWLDEIVEKRRYASRSVLVEELIRERYDQVFATGEKALGKSSSSRYPSHDPALNEARETPAAAAPPTTKKKKAA
jgi:Arc/MetJ-type ribon-helix-helix transcriptional regulator